MRVKFQSKKKKTMRIKIFGWKKTITLYTYWSTTQTSEIVVGFDYFLGHYEYEDFGLGGTPQNANKTFSETFSKSTVTLFYNGVIKAPSDFFKNWVTNLHFLNYNISVPIAGNLNTKDLIGDAYVEGMKAVKNYTTKEGSGFIYNIIGDAPRLLVSDLSNYNKEYVSLKGIPTYRNRSSIHINFGHSCGGAAIKSIGARLSGKGFTPNKFYIDEAYVFGAVKYNGYWKGIRIYIYRLIL